LQTHFLENHLAGDRRDSAMGLIDLFTILHSNIDLLYQVTNQYRLCGLPRDSGGFSLQRVHVSIICKYTTCVQTKCWSSCWSV